MTENKELITYFSPLPQPELKSILNEYLAAGEIATKSFHAWIDAHYTPERWEGIWSDDRALDVHLSIYHEQDKGEEAKKAEKCQEKLEKKVRTARIKLYKTLYQGLKEAVETLHQQEILSDQVDLGWTNMLVNEARKRASGGWPLVQEYFKEMEEEGYLSVTLISLRDGALRSSYLLSSAEHARIIHPVVPSDWEKNPCAPICNFTIPPHLAIRAPEKYEAVWQFAERMRQQHTQLLLSPQELREVYPQEEGFYWKRLLDLERK